MSDIFTTRRPPALGTVLVDELEAMAKEKLKGYPNAFLYVFSSAGDGAAARANREELARWKIVPRVLRDVTQRSLKTMLFGHTHTAPVLIGPVSVQGLMHPDGELATAAAARALGVTYTMSNSATRTIEAVAAANGDGHRWYQLYRPIDDAITLSILSRAKQSGFTALVLTVDAPVSGWRPRDIGGAYLPTLHGFGAQVGLSDPVFAAALGEAPVLDVPAFPYDPARLDALFARGDERVRRVVRMSAEWTRQTYEGAFTSWEDLRFLRENWEGPLIVKGIMSVEDAELAMDHGVDGIVVSNHGGRQVEGAAPSLWGLQQICASPRVKAGQDSGKFTVLFDSGIRTGSDVIKAIALGAQAVLLGRPYMYGLALGGQEGVEQVLSSIISDLEVTLGLSGYKSIDEIRGKADKVLVRMS
ncbi:hypothetical protein PHLGIDRAFT_27836 [Phlebiopsis gigantea 11061_1 CR5-6]|uniref:FMN hydroxy acid dehydrogenase domain-containing protein n=1 Tax=Phlebiopsis gigantea (strain 11061_1 CR5-6) TaxID=745531 RepID=A0A0C3PUZ4_PHLG1|nr:hypothetical protein PHLGIDRAFT_27836 [Phlebiopsis gigantea 11061_1 CR5-6]